ncbi:MAG: hypothetical protein RL885_12865 [Planctomycetota bacterium]
MSARPASRRVFRRATVLAVALLLWTPLMGSDHADPIDVLRADDREPGLTDLFFFPIDAEGRPIHQFAGDDVPLAEPRREPRDELTPEQQSGIAGYAAILCVRRELVDPESLNLEPYTYTVHWDTQSPVVFEGKEPPREKGKGDRVRAADIPVTGLSIEEARCRYGGKVLEPSKIDSSASISVGLDDGARIREVRVRGFAKGDEYVQGERNPKKISLWSGIRDDPFIFPGFFGTNVVAIVMTIPVDAFADRQRDFLIWATSEEDGEQVDHVGRSLRTQNPRFELLNTLPPAEHVAALKDEHEHPSLMRDVFLRLNIQSLFAFRAWDFVPDVMIYSRQYPVGFPNGRLPSDDVAALCAQFGDTLLLELSYHSGRWDRRTENDKPFLADFPYLAEPWVEGKPWPDKPTDHPHQLSAATWWKLIGIGFVLLVLLALENWIVVGICKRWLAHRRYL